MIFNTVPSNWKSVENKAPTKIPTNRELYTSFVINARAIATTGGIRDQNVAYIWGFGASSAAANTVILIKSSKAANMTRAVIIFFLFCVIVLFSFSYQTLLHKKNHERYSLLGNALMVCQ